MSSEILVFYLLFWWFMQIFYKVTSLDQEDCRIKTFVRGIEPFIVLTTKLRTVFFLSIQGLAIYLDFLNNSIWITTSYVVTNVSLFYFLSKKQFFDLINNMIDCQLCIESHLGFIISMPIAFYYEDYRLLLLGYSAAGFNNIIKRIINE